MVTEQVFITWNKKLINLTFSSPLQKAGFGDRPVIDGCHARQRTNTAPSFCFGKTKQRGCDLDGVKGSVEEHWPVLGRPLYYTFGAGERDMGAESKTLQQFDLRPVEYCRPAGARRKGGCVWDKPVSNQTD